MALTWKRLAIVNKLLGNAQQLWVRWGRIKIQREVPLDRANLDGFFMEGAFVERFEWGEPAMWLSLGESSLGSGNCMSRAKRHTE